ncbi:MAG TPA: EFR1 family ferrodoxin [Halanaerobiales bacterium]|nr:EFR1 family ferrodoxin [Halanaerobiales bacterium]
MRCLIVYFSQTNSTKKIAESIGNTIKNYDWNVVFKNIKYDKPNDILDYDLIGFGSPVYYYRLPFLVKDYLNTLPNLNDKPVFTFISYGTYFFDVPNKMKSILKEKNAVNIGFFAARGADKYLGYLNQGIYFSKGHPNERELNQAKNFAISLMNSFPNKYKIQQSYYKNITEKGIIYKFESILTKRKLISNIYSKLFSSNKNCIGCGKCVKKCPQNNITLDNNKRPKWDKDCELCFICEMACPVCAINSVVDMNFFQPILQYNVRQAIKDDNINYTEIDYQNGKIIK